MSRHDVLRWVVLCGAAGVMIGSAVVADPPASRPYDSGGSLFPIGMTLAEGRPATATTSYRVDADELTARIADEGCIVVPSGTERSGGVVLLEARTSGDGGPAPPVVLTVEQGTGTERDCTDFDAAAQVHAGMLTDIDRLRDGRPIELASTNDAELTVRVRIVSAAHHRVGDAAGSAGAAGWLDIVHRPSPDG